MTAATEPKPVTEASETPTERAVRLTVAAAPALSADKREHLARLLSNGGAA